MQSLYGDAAACAAAEDSAPVVDTGTGTSRDSEAGEGETLPAPGITVPLWEMGSRCHPLHGPARIGRKGGTWSDTVAEGISPRPGLCPCSVGGAASHLLVLFPQAGSGGVSSLIF